jgi:hypothetical protein
MAGLPRSHMPGICQGGHAVGLHRRRGAAQQPGGLAGVRREHRTGRGRPPGARQQVQRIGVDHQRLAGLQYALEHLLRPRLLAEPRPHRHHARRLQQRRQLRGTLRAVHDQFGPAGDDGEQILRRRGYGDQAAAHPQAALAGQAHCARHASSAAHEQHPSEITFIGIAPTRRQRPVDLGFADAFQQRVKTRLIGR